MIKSMLSPKHTCQKISYYATKKQEKPHQWPNSTFIIKSGSYLNIYWNLYAQPNRPSIVLLLNWSPVWQTPNCLHWLYSNKRTTRSTTRWYSSPEMVYWISLDVEYVAVRAPRNEHTLTDNHRHWLETYSYMTGRSWKWHQS